MHCRKIPFFLSTLLFSLLFNCAACFAEIPDTILYQGVLKENGKPVNGTRTLAITLYGDASCSTATRDLQKTVEINDGVFTTTLPGISSVGDDQISVSTSVGSTNLGCQAIYPAPYAIKLKPGSTMRSSSRNRILTLSNTKYLGTGYSLFAQSASVDGAAVYASGAPDGADIILGANGSSTSWDNGVLSSDPSYPESDLFFYTNDDFVIYLDHDNSGADADFTIRDKDNSIALNVDDSGYTRVYNNLTVDGNLSKAGGSFEIDHPLDPKNKILRHSFVESPDMMNVYNGNTQLDSNGEAWIELPEWFEALNRDFRYQLTPIGAPGPGLYIAAPIAENTFQIKGGTPGLTVSWQITGIRQDRWAIAHKIRVEEEKKKEMIGRYLHPDVFEKKDTQHLFITNGEEANSVAQLDKEP